MKSSKNDTDRSFYVLGSSEYNLNKLKNLIKKSIDNDYLYIYYDETGALLVSLDKPSNNCEYKYIENMEEAMEKVPASMVLYFSEKFKNYKTEVLFKILKSLDFKPETISKIYNEKEVEQEMFHSCIRIKNKDLKNQFKQKIELINELCNSVLVCPAIIQYSEYEY